MAIKNYQEYTITSHAQERVLTRFNITKSEIDKWMARLMSQCTYVEAENDRQFKYRKNDIVLIVDVKQKAVVTVYSINEHDDNPVKSHTNPEVQTVIKEAINRFVDTKRVNTAIKIRESLQKAYEANQRMANPNTPHKFTNRAWDEFIEYFNEIRSIVDSTQSIIEEARKKAE